MKLTRGGKAAAASDTPQSTLLNVATITPTVLLHTTTPMHMSHPSQPGVVAVLHYPWPGVVAVLHYPWPGVVAVLHYPWPGVVAVLHYPWQIDLLNCGIVSLSMNHLYFVLSDLVYLFLETRRARTKERFHEMPIITKCGCNHTQYPPPAHISTNSYVRMNIMWRRCKK